jgi:hypothetical protein
MIFMISEGDFTAVSGGCKPCGHKKKHLHISSRTGLRTSCSPEIHTEEECFLAN